MHYNITINYYSSNIIFYIEIKFWKASIGEFNKAYIYIYIYILQFAILIEVGVASAYKLG